MGPEPFSHQIRVRYQECDMQRVVFNAHYLAYCDETCAAWMAAAFGWDGSDDGIDWMLVRAEIDWQGSCTYGEVLTVTAGVEHWGTTSFRVRYEGRVDSRAVFVCRITYVCVRPGTTAKIPVPAFLRDALAPASATVPQPP